MILSYAMNKHDVTTWNPVTEVYKNVAERKDWEPPHTTPPIPSPGSLRVELRRGEKQQI